MQVFDTVVRGGTVVTGSDAVVFDVGMLGERIAALGANLPAAVHEIDARGKLVLPGGIEGHCHLDQDSSSGSRTADDYLSGTRSALCGGTTTVISFAPQLKGHSLLASLADYHARAAGKAMIDYSFHMIVSEPTPELLRSDLAEVIRSGVTSLKVFMCYDTNKLDDYQILDVMSVAKREGALMMVHAENHAAAIWLGARLVEQGLTAPKHHSAARPEAIEREATHRAIALAEVAGVPLMVVHVSSKDAMDQIVWARARRLPIYAETCTQYLFLSEDDLDRPGFEGAKFIFTPPARKRANQDAIWYGLESGIFDILSSDHAPFAFDGPFGKKRNGDTAPFMKIANGLPGIELRLPLLFSEGVRKGRISLSQFVALSSTNAAKLYGLYPRKGSIAVGVDADIAIWDPNVERSIDIAMLHDNMDYTPYQGMRVTGWPVIVLSRGDVVYRDNHILAKAGRGRFLKRAHWKSQKEQWTRRPDDG